ncbi:hypothetical protein Tel_15395 [Candidatus Tenderia electrophaga]|jgi:hypothetical protein|uniref:Uncharacterized protein n=1 Tax=Candidatus Tenderia electrophaga TaxID=1748243 RepID=A0A0S2TH12_9GAMM|nr:hypothetical protein Tel_15395 [Candidatus Tenderia electrophaga]
MKRKNEIIPADKQMRKTWLILIALYILILLWLEPIIDFFLMQMPLDRSHEAIVALNQKKAYVASIAFGVMRSLPILTFAWFGLLIMQAARLPPKSMRLPITVVLIEGPRARMIGMVMMAVGLLLLLREISMLVSAQPAF